MRWARAIVGVMACMVTVTAAAVAADEPEYHLVYASGEKGYGNIRTGQLLVTEKGTLIALAQGRSTPDDRADIDILSRRSTDGGRTWSPITVIAESGRDALNSVDIVQVKPGGRIIAMGSIIPEGYEAHDLRYMSEGMRGYLTRAGRDKNKVLRPGYEGPDIQRVYVVTSDDDGQTWSKMVDVTTQAKLPPPVVWAMPGPGIGIQLQAGPHAGRVIMPAYALWLDTTEAMPSYSYAPHAIYSDDGGGSWKAGPVAPFGKNLSHNANEAQVVELEDGSVMVNSRHVHRVTAVSKDGGESWSPLRKEPTLTGPACAGGLVRYSFARDGGRGRIIFSHPGDDKRMRGLIWLSYDDGKTWPVSKVIRPGRFDYSCLNVLPDGRIGCIFGAKQEEGDGGEAKLGTTTVMLAKFSLGWLTEGKDTGR